MGTCINKTIFRLLFCCLLPVFSWRWCLSDSTQLVCNIYTYVVYKVRREIILSIVCKVDFNVYAPLLASGTCNALQLAYKRNPLWIKKKLVAIYSHRFLQHCTLQHSHTSWFLQWCVTSDGAITMKKKNPQLYCSPTPWIDVWRIDWGHSELQKWKSPAMKRNWNQPCAWYSRIGSYAYMHTVGFAHQIHTATKWWYWRKRPFQTIEQSNSIVVFYVHIPAAEGPQQ